MAVAALLLRLPFLGESLWADELHTAWVVADDAQTIPLRAAMGNQSPLYFFGVWTWLQAVGMHQWSLRLPSLIAGIFAVGLVTAVSHRWSKDAWIALGIGLLAAMDNDWIFFATEARTYTLVQWVAILQVLLAWDASQNDRTSAWIGLVALSLTNFYLHYTTILFTTCVGIAILICAGDRTIRKHFALASIGLLLGIGISVPHLMTIFERRSNWAQFISATSSSEWYRWETVFAMLLPAGIASVIAWFRHETNITSMDRRRFVFLNLVVLLPITIGWLTTATGVAALFFGRYLFSAETCVLILLASMMTLLPGRWIGRAAIVLALLVCCVYRLPTQWQTMRGEDWPTIVNAVSQNIEAMDTPPEIVIAAGLIETDFLRTKHANEAPWDDYARLPIESIYHLPEAAKKRFGLTYTNAGEPTPRYLEESTPESVVIMIVRGNRAKANQVATRFRDALPDRHYQIKTPKPQASGVQWRILVPHLGDN